MEILRGVRIRRQWTRRWWA